MAHVFLVVDQSERDVSRSVQQLQAAHRGAEVLVPSTGEAALALLEERKVVPSLIFVSFDLPDMNGIQFLGHVRQTRWLVQAPVAMLCDTVNDRDVVSCYRLGACAVLTRPVQTHELRETLRDFARPAVVLAGTETSVNQPQARSSAA